MLRSAQHETRRRKKKEHADIPRNRYLDVGEILQNSLPNGSVAADITLRPNVKSSITLTQH